MFPTVPFVDVRLQYGVYEIFGRLSHILRVTEADLFFSLISDHLTYITVIIRH